jgi:UDP-2-acetamido-3-amino-2,3-dideoxy-glucuronate N-acetyltransferase
MKTKYFIHSSAEVDKGAKIGSGTKVWHNSHITDSAVVGKSCILGQNCYVAGRIGSHCKLQNNVNLYQGVTLEDYVFCGPSMTFTNDINPRAKYPKDGKWLKTKVKEGASLGAGTVILCGIVIGKWAFVGAGSVVTKNIPDFGLYYGNPAAFKGWICECGAKMTMDFTKYTCKNCSRKYTKKGDKVTRV